MGMAHVGLVHCDPCECKVKGFRAVSSIERNVSNRRHLQGVRQRLTFELALLHVSRLGGLLALHKGTSRSHLLFTCV